MIRSFVALHDALTAKPRSAKCFCLVFAKWFRIVVVIIAFDHFQIIVTLDGAQLSSRLSYMCRFSVREDDNILSETTFDNFSEENSTGICQYNTSLELRIPAGRGKRFFSRIVNQILKIRLIFCKKLDNIKLNQEVAWILCFLKHTGQILVGRLTTDKGLPTLINFF